MNKKKGIFTKPIPQNQSLIKYYYQGYSLNEISQICLKVSTDDRHRVNDIVGSIIKVNQQTSENTKSINQQLKIQLFDNGSIFSIGSDFQMRQDSSSQNKYFLKQNIKKSSVDLFVLKLCDHFPTQEILERIQKQLVNIQSSIIEIDKPKQKKLKKKAPSPPMNCRFCGKILEFFYLLQQKEVTIMQIYNQLQIEQIQQIQQIQWEVSLNEHFTKNTSVSRFQDRELKLDQCGKITYLVDWKQLKSSQLKNNFVILKYRKIYCKHQKIQNNMCQVCLESVDPIQLNLKKYLFQMDMQDQYNKQMITSGDTLLEQQNLFVEKLYANNKAILILDLDNTVLHSVQLNKLPAQRLNQFDQYYQIPFTSDIRHATLITCFVVKMRPYFKQFLQWICQYYEIYVYTKGTRSYAESICNCIRQQYAEEKLVQSINLNTKLQKHSFLKNKNCFTLNRIITRDQDTDLYSKSIDNILPNRQDCLMIMDDLKQVWKHSLSCLHTIPYYFFWKIQTLKLLQRQQKKNKNSSEVLQKEIKQFEQKKNLSSQPLLQLPCDQFQQQIIRTEKQILEKQETGKLEFASEVVDLVKVTNAQYDSKPTKDYFLLFAAQALIQIHRNFFELKSSKDFNTETLSLAKTHKLYRAEFFKGKAVKFCMDYQERVDIHGRADKLGLQILKKQAQEIPHFIIRLNSISKNLDRVFFKPQEQNLRIQAYKKKQQLTKSIIKKIKYFNQTLKIPIVSQSWISMSYLYTYPFQVDSFIIPEDKILQDIQQKQYEWIVQQKSQQILQMRGEIQKRKLSEK